jgi:hypothetical protein
MKSQWHITFARDARLRSEFMVTFLDHKRNGVIELGDGGWFYQPPKPSGAYALLGDVHFCTIFLQLPPQKKICSFCKLMMFF